VFFARFPKSPKSLALLDQVGLFLVVCVHRFAMARHVVIVRHVNTLHHVSPNQHVSIVHPLVPMFIMFSLIIILPLPIACSLSVFSYRVKIY
jgi:hypothetical protein